MFSNKNPHVNVLIHLRLLHLICFFLVNLCAVLIKIVNKNHIPKHYHRIQYK